LLQSGTGIYVSNSVTIDGELRLSNGSIIAENDATIESLHMVSGFRPDGAPAFSPASIKPNGHALTLGKGAILEGYIDVIIGDLNPNPPRGSFRFEGMWT